MVAVGSKASRASATARAIESREKAEAWYNCAEYQAALPIRLGATEGYAVIVDEFAPAPA